MNPPIDLSPLPDLFPHTSPELDFCATPLEQLLSPESPPQAPHAKPLQEKESTASPTGVLAAPGIFSPHDLGSSTGNPALSSLIKSSTFKSTLKSVLSRPQTTAHNDVTLSRTYADRSCDKPQSPPRSRNLTQPSQRRSVQNLRPHKTSTARKHRSSSCGKLPRRRSQDSKRPCDLADTAIANGTPLTKEEARAIRNREHAMASRLRAKQKRQSLVADNIVLKERVQNLEAEQMRLRKERDELRLRGRDQREFSKGRLLFSHSA